MAKDEKTRPDTGNPLTPPSVGQNPIDMQLENQRRQAAELAARAAQAAQPAMGVLDRVRGTGPAAEEQKHTFGAWARAKGVKDDQIRKALEAGRVSGTGDGPMMTEQEFDKAVEFKVTSEIPGLPTISTDISAEDARRGLGKAPPDNGPDDRHR